jgi:glycosyltransferase involved in cell wall biosynthesis
MMAAWATTAIKADLLIVSSHFAAHAATRRFDGPSIVYYHTPARLLWRPDLEIGRINPAARQAVEGAILPVLRKYDKWVAQQSTQLIANSSAVAERIRQCYGRDAEVVHPPVMMDDITASGAGGSQSNYVVWLGRLVAYKRPEIAYEAARQADVPIVFVGDGPMRAHLELRGYGKATFVGRVGRAEAVKLLQGAAAMLFPGEEDFGIAPVEALAAGVPVIAFDGGGARDYVHHRLNGLLVPTQSAPAFANSITTARLAEWNPTKIRESAEKFDLRNFQKNLRKVIDPFVTS